MSETDPGAPPAPYREEVPTETPAETPTETWLAALSRRHPLVADALLAVLVGGFNATTMLLAGDLLGYGYAYVGTEAAVAGALSAVPLVVRRAAPVATLGVLLAALLALSAAGFPVMGIETLVALYTVAAYRPRTVGTAALAATLAVVAVSLVASPAPVYVANIISSGALTVAGWAFGRTVRVRRAYVAELERRAEALQATREADTRAVLAEERGRIARELHDVVAHHVSVMTVQASAARRTIDRDVERTREAITAIETTGRAALVEMRRVVGVLRGGETGTVPEQAAAPGGLTPQPGLADLDRLVDQLREAGLTVVVREEGMRRPLDTGIDLTAFRVVQEALTNTLKHAGTTEATVVLRWAPGALDVRVVDDGRGATTCVDGVEGWRGHGLVGMRERVAVHGGHVQAGPRRGGGFEVAARIPLEVVAS